MKRPALRGEVYDPGPDIATILKITAVMALPTFVTIATVRVSLAELHTTDDPTPLGYTVSLLLFLVPIMAVVLTHIRHAEPYDRRAFVQCAALMTAVGVVLDLAFAYSFFRFPNTGATLGIRAPAWSWEDMRWIPDYIPVEEFGFYILGAVFMVSVYLWADAYWLREYRPPAYRARAEAHLRIVQVSPVAAAAWVGLLSYGVVHKHVLDAGWPEYYMFLMAAGVLPSLLLIRTVKKFVNWHALGFTFAALVFISVIWEATLAVPYGWWAYRETRMLGFTLRPWSDLPVEAVILWMVGVWDAVLFYELFRIRHVMADRSWKTALFGTRAPTGEVRG